MIALWGKTRIVGKNRSVVNYSGENSVHLSFDAMENIRKKEFTTASFVKV